MNVFKSDDFTSTWWWRLLRVLYITIIICTFLFLLWIEINSGGELYVVEIAILLLFDAAIAISVRAATYYVIEGFSEDVQWSLKILVVLVILGVIPFLIDLYSNWLGLDGVEIKSNF